MGYVLGQKTAGHEHGCVRLCTVRVTASNTVVLLGYGNDLVPHPFHVSPAQYRLAEQEPGNIVPDDGMVEDFLATHGLNGDYVRILGAFLERLEKKGYLKSEWKMTSTRPQKKFSLTKDGQVVLNFAEGSLNLIRRNLMTVPSAEPVQEQPILVTH